MMTATLTALLLAATANAQPDAPKILARAATVLKTPTVIRTPEQLGALRMAPADAASAELAKQFKVDKIDWTKQMVVVVSGGPQPTGGYGIEAKSLEVKDKILIVHWKVIPPARGSLVTQAFTHPSLTILVDRFDGNVVFEPKAPRGAD